MKEIIGYEKRYSVTADGMVFSHLKGLFLTPIKQNTGYLSVNISKGNSLPQKAISIHRLVAEAYLANPENKPCVNHKDLDKTNNRVNNLEWVTHSENSMHSSLLQGHSKGMKNGNSKLTDLDIIQIREKYAFRKHTYKMLSAEFGVCKNYIGRIIKGIVWDSV